MKLKRKDLELLMQYLEKEKPELVEVSLDSTGLRTSVCFGFKDLESRDCSIQLYDAQFNITPDLTKVMKLYSRFKKEPSGGTSSPGDSES